MHRQNNKKKSPKALVFINIDYSFLNKFQL
ncbi:hypothetical protein SPACI_030240 [Sporomusa acidovorans DSM 3132]|uniref:Uncharacterized protein n=1 Tax=Sporomusa acidovorans (strain ATCC 49682 / DSM 3132 / Mol) TaxID=1123286 RepID=A0ABZ3J3J9_SPOA4